MGKDDILGPCSRGYCGRRSIPPGIDLMLSAIDTWCLPDRSPSARMLTDLLGDTSVRFDLAATVRAGLMRLLHALSYTNTDRLGRQRSSSDPNALTPYRAANAPDKEAPILLGMVGQQHVAVVRSPLIIIPMIPIAKENGWARLTVFSGEPGEPVSACSSVLRSQPAAFSATAETSTS